MHRKIALALVPAMAFAAVPPAASAAFCPPECRTDAVAAPPVVQAPAPHGRTHRPASSVVRPGDAGVRAHTNVEVSVPPTGAATLPPPASMYAPRAR